ncbi:MAG: phosphoribosylformylglycinamidine synthase subunit PurQ [Cytophagales bacterium]|nr:phosphoribosylformylglycinamidine synthase subunit PurQ [Cytophagales bacterium]
MKFGVVVFPGSNCDEDMVYALRDIMRQQVVKLWHKNTSLEGCDMVILPGGFSYGDYLRSGAIARFSPIMTEVVNHAQKGGYVLGICNGFQILAETGLVPGALIRNINLQFICDNQYIKPANNTLINRTMQKDTAYKIPIAHGDGRYYIDSEGLKKITDNEQIIFKYCDENGDITYNSNPNGSLLHIAGVCNTGRNVFGMMPHPERAIDPDLGNTDGRLIFESIIEQVLVSE